eukprot:gene8670-10181_t
MATALRVCAVIACLSMLVALSSATHYRGGSVTWTPRSPTYYYIIDFKIELSFMMGFSDFTCSGKYPLQVGQYIKDCDGNPYKSEVNLGLMKVGVWNYFLFIKTSQKTVLATAVVNSINADFFTATIKLSFEYPKVDAEYATFYQGQARISNLNNNADMTYYLETHVVVKKPTGTAAPNTAPMANTYPVMTVTNGILNKFVVLASDIETPNQLTYDLSSPGIMGDSNTPQYNPPGLTITKNGIISFTPPQLGFFCAQILITDPQGAWVTADFLIKSVSQSVNPPYFVAPTPDETTPVYCAPLEPCTWSYVGKTDIAGRGVVISVAYLPSGVVENAPTGSQTVTIVNTWTPTVAQTGRFVVNLGITDTAGVQMVGQRSFVIIVKPSACGNGHEPTGCVPSSTNHCCQCDDGWDPQSECYECLPNRWGPLCKPDPKCVNGTANSGPTGDGTCLCYLGFSGPLCNVSISARCNPDTDSGIITSTQSQGYLSPASAQVFLAAPIPFPYTISVPMMNPLPIFDVYLLLEAGSGTDLGYYSYKNYINNFVSTFESYGDGASFGFGFYSYLASDAILFQHVNSIGTSIISDVKAMKEPIPLTKNPALVFNSLKAAASYSVGWRNGAHRTMIICGVSDAVTSTPALVAETFNIFKQRSIMPLFLSNDGADLPNLSAAFASNFGYFKIGSRVGSAPISASWITDVFGLFTKATTGTVNAYVLSDTTPIVSGPLVPTYDTSNGRIAKIPVNLLLPTPVPTSQSSSVTLAVIGFGVTTITTLYNHAPIGLAANVTLYEDAPQSFTLSSYVSDSDSNVLTIRFPSVTTSLGQLQLGNGQPCASGFQYSSTQAFRFVPNANAIGSVVVPFIVEDGCAGAAPTNLNIVINPVNDLPTCSAFSASATIDSPALITLAGADIDDEASTLSVILDSLATASTLGDLTIASSNAAAVAGTVYPIATQFKFKPTTNPATTSSASFTFTIKDAAGGVSTRCTASVSIGHVNVAPTVTSSATVTVTPNAQDNSVLTLQASDVDSTSVTFVLSSIINRPVTNTDGKFVNCADNTPITSSTTIPAVNLVNGAASTTICYLPPFAKPANGLNYASITFLAMDNEGLSSDQFTIVINVIGDRVNRPPVAIAVDAISLDQDTDSVSFTLDGTDPDIDDQGKLNSLFTTPANGVLLLASAPVTSSQGKAPLVLQYRPNPGFVGTDSFTFKVSDTFGATSDDKTVSFTVKFVNHAPTVLINSYTFTQINHPIQTVHVTDNDANSVVSCKVTTLPTTGSLTDSADTVLKVGDVITTFKCLEPTPSPQTAFDTTFSVNCCDEFTLCASATGDIHYSYVNQPPQSLDSQVVTDQAVDKSFTFKVTDETASSVKILLASLPVHGQFKLADGTVVTSINDKLEQTLIYSPDPKLSNADTPGGAGPLDQVSFYAVDSQGLQSQVAATVTFSVIPKPPPYYDGLQVLQTQEDTNLTFLLEAHAGDHSPNIYLTITEMSPVSQGYLMKWSCSEDGCMHRVVLDDTIANLGQFRLKYVPPQDKFGNQFFNFSFTMTSNEITSEKIYISIDVSPINDNPVFVPIDPPTNVVTMKMSTTQVIKFTATDVDNPITMLSPHIGGSPPRGKMYLYNASNPEGDYMGGEFGTHNVGWVFPPCTLEEPFFRFVYKPYPRQSGLAYDTISMYVQDYTGGLSVRFRYVIDVSPVNAPPVITVNQTKFNVSVSTDLIITGVSVDDPDSYYNNITITVSVINEVGVVQNSSRVALASTYNNSCISTPGSITCLDSEEQLNYYLAQITTSHPTDGTFLLRVFVDDLGYNSFPSVRNISHLTDTKNLTIVVGSGGIKKPNNTTLLSAVIAAVAVAAALIALGVWRFLKKAAPPTDAFFGDSPFSDASISANPLYQESGNAGNNPLYEQGA